MIPLSIVNAVWDVFRKATAAPLPEQLPGVVFYDRRRTAAQAHGERGKWKVGRRSIKKLTGICLHQTACVLGERPERWDTVGAHFGITRSGAVMWLHDFDHLVAAANGWNDGTVSIEVDGLFAGDERDPASVWDDPSTKKRELGMEPTPEQIHALQQLIRWIHDKAAALGANIRVLVAHRQSSKSRRDDPGSAVWRRGALPMMAELGLSDGGVGFVLGGYPIPECWDPRAKSIPY